MCMVGIRYVYMNKLSYSQVVDKYSKEFLVLLCENTWLQEMSNEEYGWYEKYNGVSIPSLQILWDLVVSSFFEDKDESKLLMGRCVDGYCLLIKNGRKKKKLEFFGTCPEEVLLKGLINVDNIKL
jgi:hypothetical protein